MVDRDVVEQDIRAVLSGRGLSKKKNLWYEILPGGIRGLYFSKNPWRSRETPEYEPRICFFPAEYLTDQMKMKVPPPYKFPISDYIEFLPGVTKAEVQDLFDAARETNRRRQRMAEFLESRVRPVYLRLSSLESAKRLVERGILRDAAFIMPAREVLTSYQNWLRAQQAR